MRKLVDICNQSELIPQSRLPTVLTIAGSDPSGGAGVEADIKTITVLGCFGMTCVDGITIQNTMGVYGKHVTSLQALQAILTSIENEVDVIKIGMMTDNVVEWFKRYYHGQAKYLVVDPIISSSSGYTMAKQQMIRNAANFIYCKATLLTPNFNEAIAIVEILGKSKSKYAKHDLQHYKMLAQDLTSYTGARAILLKGGHMPSIDSNMLDILYDSTNNSFTLYKHAKIIGAKNTHGTGCTLSSAIASYLSKGETLQDSVKKATIFLHNAMRFADISLGKGKGPLNHIYNL